jgi:hypothetical protein
MSDQRPSKECDALIALKYDTCECMDKCEPCRGVRQKAIDEIERLQAELSILQGVYGEACNHIPADEPETEHCPDCHSAFWYSRNGVTGAQETCKNKWHDRAVQPPKGGPGSIQHRFDSLCAWLREKFDLEPNVFSSIAPETWIKEGIEHALEQRATVPPGNEWRSSKELPSGDSVVLTFDGYVFSCEYAYDVNPKEHLFWMRIPALPPSVSTKLEGQS